MNPSTNSVKSKKVQKERKIRTTVYTASGLANLEEKAEKLQVENTYLKECVSYIRNELRICRQILSQRGVNLNDVDNYLREIFSKCNVNNR